MKQGFNFAEQMKQMRERMETDPMFRASAKATGIPNLAEDLKKTADKMIKKAQQK